MTSPGTVHHAMARDLSAVLADGDAKAMMLRQIGQPHVAAIVETLVREVRASADDYLTWIDESAAVLRSGRTVPWLCHRFPIWQRSGHAECRGRRRYYRRLIVPERTEWGTNV